MQIPLIKGDRQSDFDYRSSLPVNMTAVARAIKGSDGYLLTHDGLTLFSDTGGNARGGVWNKQFNTHYRVSDNALEEVAEDGTITTLGVVAGSSPCSFAASFNTQAILSDGKLYYWDNASLKQVLDPDLGVPIDITWFRGIYVMTDGDFLFHTDIANEFSISPLKYSSSEFDSDKIVAVARNDRNQVIAFNRYSTEYFEFDPTVPTGTSVLVAIPQASNKIGIVGTKCQTLLDGNFFILGGRQEESPSIHILGGLDARAIATREIDQILSKYKEEELEGAILESRVVDRDKFLIVHLPNETLLYNHTIAQKAGIESAWTFVKSGVEVDEPWRGIYGVFDPRAAKWIYGDKIDGRLGYLDDKSAAQYGEQVECVCYTPIIPLETASIDEMSIKTISGYGNYNFTSALSMSFDGVTYGKEHWNIISSPDDYSQRYIARRLGYIREYFNFKFRFVSIDKMALSTLEIGYS